MRSKELGRWAEEKAAAFLESRGFRVLARNYRSRRAEADLVVTDGETLVFVEVKSRRQGRFGSPWEAIDRRKRQRLVAAALDFWARHPRYRTLEVRFDAIAVERDAGQRGWRLRWLPDAFSPHDFL